MSVYDFLKRIGPLRTAVRGVRGWIYRYRVDAWILSGKERHSGQPLTVLVAGQLENKNYIREVMFEQPCVETHRRMWRRSVRRRLRVSGGSFSVVVYDTTEPPERTLKDTRTYYLPNWVITELDLAAANKRLEQSENARKDVKRILRKGYGYTISTAATDFEMFYDSMYLPYLARRFGGQGMAVPRDLFTKGTQADAELLVVTWNGEPVAGVVLRYSDGEPPAAWILGVRGGDLELVKQHVLMALHYFEVKHVSEKGLTRLQLGGARPFLRDGVLQFKKKWGAKIMSAHEHERQWFALRIVDDSPGARSFLTHNPFVYEDERGLAGTGSLTGVAVEVETAERYLRQEFQALGIDRYETAAIWAQGTERASERAGETFPGNMQKNAARANDWNG